MTRRWVEDQRSLPYCPKTNSSLPIPPISAPTWSRSPRLSACRAGRPVTTAMARTTPARSTRTWPASGWMCASDGSSTIGERTPSKSSPTTVREAAATSRGVTLLALAGGEVHATHPTTQGQRSRTCRPGAGAQAASSVRTTVSRSSRIEPVAGTSAGDAQVEGQQLARGLEPGGVVDGRAGDGAVPVVGADDLPADVGRGPGVAAGQTGDAGVVVDLDVDVAAGDLALDRLLLALRQLLLRVGVDPGLGLGRAGHGGDLALGGLLALGRDVGDPGHGDREDAQQGDRRGEGHAALVAGRGSLRRTVTARSRGGGPSAGAGGRRAAGAAGGPGAGRTRAPRAGR